MLFAKIIYSIWKQIIKSGSDCFGRRVEIIYSFISHLEERSFDFESFKERFSENLNNRANIYLVATDEADNPVGFVSCHGQSLLHHEGKVFEIQEIYVARNWRDRGIGKALLAALE